MQATDMIVSLDGLKVVEGLPVVDLRLQTPETRDELLGFVAEEYPSFLQYYQSPRDGKGIYGIWQQDQLVGTVLLETQHPAVETSEDAAIACLITAERLRGQGIGSAAIATCCILLRHRGFRRVIAEHVASIHLYSRLGFQVWKIRD